MFNAGTIAQCENYHLKEVADYFRQVIAMNEYQKERFARRILKQMFGTVRRKRILILGYAFKKVLQAHPLYACHVLTSMRRTPAIPVSRLPSTCVGS